jgi:Zn-finger nucleic acid-binding protein
MSEPLLCSKCDRESVAMHIVPVMGVEMPCCARCRDGFVQWLESAVNSRNRLVGRSAIAAQRFKQAAGDGKAVHRV